MLDLAANEFLTQTSAGTPMGEYFRRFWVPVLDSKKLPEPDGEPVRTTIMSEELVAFRDTSGRVGLVDAYCAHRCAPLFFGRNEGLGLRCIYHGWKYDIDGNCTDMPNESEHSRFKEHVKLKAYPTHEAGGLIWAYMGPVDKRPEFPDLEFLSVPEDQRYMETYVIEGNYLQALEGDHDTSHVNFLHATLNNWIADPTEREATRQFIDVHMNGKAPTLITQETPYGFLTASRREAGSSHYYWRITPFLAPFYSLIAAEPGGSLGVNIRVPRDDVSSWDFRMTYIPDRPFEQYDLDVYRSSGYRYPHKDDPESYIPNANKGNDYLVDRYVQRYQTFTGIKSILDQDRAVTEGTPIIDRSRENLGASDASIVAVRQCLRNGAEALLNGQEPPQASDGSLYRVRSVALTLPRDIAFEEGAQPYMSCATWARQERSEILVGALDKQE